MQCSNVLPWSLPLPLPLGLVGMTWLRASYDAYAVQVQADVGAVQNCASLVNDGKEYCLNIENQIVKLPEILNLPCCFCKNIYSIHVATLITYIRSSI